MAKNYKKRADSRLGGIVKSIKRKKHLKQLLWLLMTTIIFIFFASGSRGTYQLARFLGQKENLEKEIKQLEQEKKELQKVKDRLENDPEYIEKVAREKYKMKKKGEQVYQVVEDE
jgi:cell division protein FtsB